MPFKSEAQRRWFFANNGGGYSPVGKSKKYIAGNDPIETLTKQNPKKIEEAIKVGNKQIFDNKKDSKEIKKYNNLLKKGIDSKSKNYDEKQGKYNLPRRKIHMRLINKVDNPNAYPEDGKQPKVIFIGGLTASGKSSVVAKLIDRKEGEPDYKSYPKFVYLNSDDFKSWLPEYDGYNSGYLHEESTDIFENALKKYRRQKKQIIIDATLKNKKNALKKIKSFDKAGYEIILYGTNIPGEESIKRATKRFERTKRYVPLNIIGKNAEPTNESVLKLRHDVDKYKIMSTNVPLGEPPVLIESDTSIKQDREQDAKIIVHTEEEWRRLGVDKSDLMGYDTKKHKKVKKN